MAQIKGFDYFGTRWLLALDVAGLQERVEQAPNLPNTLLVVFVGEQHTSEYDVARRHRLAAALMHSLDALESMFVFERFPDVADEERERIVVERGSLKSADDMRNEMMVGRAEAEYSRLIAASEKVRSLVFFCGDVHEQRVRQLFPVHFPKTLGLHWLKVSPIMDLVEKELANYGAVSFDTSRMFAAGYATGDVNCDHRLLLLTKGKVKEPFNLEIVGPELLQMAAREGYVTAVYFKDVRLNMKCRRWIHQEGSVHVRDYIRMAGDQCVVAVKMPLEEALRRERELVG